jgi:hypothetical protein
MTTTKDEEMKEKEKTHNERYQHNVKLLKYWISKKKIQSLNKKHKDVVLIVVA